MRLPLRNWEKLINLKSAINLMADFFLYFSKMKILVIALSGIGDALMFTPSARKN